MIKMMEKMQKCLMECVHEEMEDLASVDTKELGEAIDMIKDLSEAIYYCTVTEAMHSTDEGRRQEEGHSHITRKMYMEHKQTHHSKEVQMQELEKYMQELTHELTEMIEGSSIEEKQMLQRKLSALVSKIV